MELRHRFLRVLVVLAALAARHPGEVVVDPGLRRARHVGHVRLEAPELDLGLQGVRVAAARPAYPVLEPHVREVELEIHLLLGF